MSYYIKANLGIVDLYFTFMSPFRWHPIEYIKRKNMNDSVASYRTIEQAQVGINKQKLIYYSFGRTTEQT